MKRFLFAGLQALLCSVLSADVVLNSDQPSYNPGEPVEVSWSGRTDGGFLDWIGIYASGSTPGSGPYTLWSYVDGTMASGSATFNSTSLPAGTWTAAFHPNNSNVVLATTSFTVTGAPPPTFTLDTDQDGYEVGETITVNWTGRSGGSGTDWVGIYAEGVTPGIGAYTTWHYVDGTMAAGTTTFDSTTLGAGTWTAAYHPNGGTTVLGTAAFEVTAPPQITIGNLTDGGEHLIYRNAIRNPKEIHPADVDGDGDLDVLALGAANQADTLIWLENTGLNSGVMGPARLIDHTHETRAIAPADLDGDGDLDVAACSTGFDDRVFWFENLDGEGSFGPLQVVAASGNNGDIAAADLDRDGDKDLVWVSFFSGALQWAANDGGGNFGAPATLLTAPVDRVATGDLDADGDNDVVATVNGASASVVWVRNTTPPGSPGAGSFAAGATTIGPLNTVGGLAVANLDGDAAPDVVVSSGPDTGFGIPTGIVWFDNNGSGAFSSALPVAAAQEGVIDLSGADIDGDNDTDVVFADQFTHELGWVRNTNGAGSFAAAVVISDDFDFLQCCAAAKLDGDADPEVLYGTWAAEIGFFENTPGGFANRTALTGGIESISSLSLGDVNGDGRPDLLGTASNEGEVYYFPGNNAGGFGSRVVLNASVGEVSDALAAELNGAPGPDLVVALTGDTVPPEPDQFLLLPNNGANQFPATTVLDGPPSDAPWSACAADLDADNDLDLVMAWSGTDEVKWMKNLGGGNFAAPVTLGVSDGCRSVAAANLNGVPGLEVVCAGWGDGDVKVFTNQGTGNLDTFTAASTVADLTSGTEGLQLADMDGDTDLDVFFVVTSGTGGPVYWVENLGVNSGTFGAVPTVIDPGGDSVRSAVPVDLDNDGDLDCASVRADGNGTIRLYENLGGGVFDFHESLSSGQKTAYNSEYILHHDVDGDGDEDLIVGSASQGSIYWYENRWIDGSADPFSTWAAGFGLAADPDLVPADGDGLSLVEQYAYNLNPTVADAVILPAGVATAGLPRIYFEVRGADRWLVAEYLRRVTPGNRLTYEAEGSPNLSSWVDVTDNETSSPVNSDFERVHVERNAGSAPAYFGSVRVEWTPPP